MSVGPGGRSRLLPVAIVALLTVVAAGCDTSGGPSPSPSATVSPAAGSASPSPAGATPTPVTWPNSVVQAVLALGAADSEIQLAGNDFLGAVETQDLRLMLKGSDRIVELTEALQPAVERLRQYPATAEVAGLYDAAFPEMLAGATEISASLRAGDADGVVAGSRRLSAGLEGYGALRAKLGDLVDKAMFMQRLLVK